MYINTNSPRGDKTTNNAIMTMQTKNEIHEIQPSMPGFNSQKLADNGRCLGQ